MREEGAFLWDDTDAAAFRRDIDSWGDKDLLVEAYFTGVGALEAGDDAEEGTFATAGSPEDRCQAAERDLEIDTTECVDSVRARGECLLNAGDTEHD